MLSTDFSVDDTKDVMPAAAANALRAPKALPKPPNPLFAELIADLDLSTAVISYLTFGFAIARVKHTFLG